MNNSAAGYDELPSSIMKQCVETYYVKQLTFLINMAITQGTFPNELKIARVILLYEGERYSINIKLSTNFSFTLYLKFF